MDIKELKSRIESGKIDDSPLILKYSDNKFLCKHYVNNIARVRNKIILYVSSIEDLIDDSNLFEMEDIYLRVLDVEDLKEYPTEEMKNLIVICKSVPKDLTLDYIDMTKVVNWQIEDFVRYRLSGLTDDQLKWLCESCKYDIYRLDNECKKLEIFLPALQKTLFDEQARDNSFCDLSSKTIFNLTESIVKKDINGIKEVLFNRNYIDIEPAGLVTILIKNYYKIILTITSTGWVEAMSSLISEKQYKYFKAVYAKLYSLSQLVKIYEILTGIDYKLKSGQIDYNNTIDYLLIKILGV